MKKRKEKKQGLAWKGTIKKLVGNGKTEYCKHFSWKWIEKRGGRIGKEKVITIVSF